MDDINKDTNIVYKPPGVMSTSGVPGVYRIRRGTMQWVARINLSGRWINLGYFKEKADAVAARRYAEMNPESVTIHKPGPRHKKYHTKEEKEAGYKARHRASYEKNKLNPSWVAKRKESNKSWYSNNQKDPVKSILNSARTRARKNGLEFNLTQDDLAVPLICPVLGIPIFFGRSGFGKHLNDSASMDRIIPERGYVKDNIKIISMRANILKRDCTDPEELRKVADYIEQNLIERKTFDLSSKQNDKTDE